MESKAKPTSRLPFCVASVWSASTLALMLSKPMLAVLTLEASETVRSPAATMRMPPV
jgi:hypothetical protein